jgi:hypothetical protein
MGTQAVGHKDYEAGVSSTAPNPSWQHLKPVQPLLACTHCKNRYQAGTLSIVNSDKLHSCCKSSSIRIVGAAARNKIGELLQQLQNLMDSVMAAPADNSTT